VKSLENLLKLSELGVHLSPDLHLLGATGSSIDSKATAAFLRDLNIEKHSRWEMRTYCTPEKPHRRFLVCSDGSIVTCGLSLNNLNKDEVLELIPRDSELAKHDRTLFEEKWKLAVVLR